MSHSNSLASIPVAGRIVSELLFTLHPSARSILGGNLRLVCKLRERGDDGLQCGNSEESKRVAGRAVQCHPVFHAAVASVAPCLCKQEGCQNTQ